MSGTVAQRFCTGLRRVSLGGILCLFAVGTAPAAPPNDNLASAAVLTGVTNFATGSNDGATFEVNEPSHANAVGGKSVWWTWQSPFTGSVFISTAGSSFDTLLSVYTGDAIPNLQVVVENDDVDGGFGVVTSAVIFRAYAGEIFRIAVDGYSGATGTVRLAVGRAGSPMEIAGPVLFLCTPLAGFISGEVMNVNGGAVLVG